jgi:hypothetical protein
MTADQGYHGASSMASDTMFKPKSHFSQESSSEGDGGTGY